jgi:hypothetical protein
MPTTPPGAKKPQDRKPTAAETLESELNQDELLADLPELKAPARLRLRERNVILKLAINLRSLMDEGDESESASINIDEDDARMPLLLDVLADIDEFAESIAVDKDAYVEWSLNKDYETFSALLMRYASAVGESSAS